MWRRAANAFPPHFSILQPYLNPIINTMEKITYGAPRLVDWVAQIKAGAATVRVHFTGGALTSYGVTPAEYTTANPFIQKVIENSTYYKEGRIILLRKTEIADTRQPKPRKPKAEAAQQTESTPRPNAESKSDEVQTPAIAATPVVDTEQEQSIGGPTAEADENKTESTGLKNVEVTCLQDAQAYLQENFNISSYKVRSYESAQRAAEEHGVQFTGAKFDSLNNIEKEESAEVEE